MDADTPPPAVVPTNDGRVLLEWHAHGVDLEIEILSANRFHVTFEDAGGGGAWEREFGPDLSVLSDVMVLLSK